MARPSSVAADGNVKVAWLTTVTLTGPTVAQLTAGVDLSYYLTPDGWAPTVDEQQITDDRLADTQTFENRGRFTQSLGSIRYVYNPVSAPDNLAYTTLVTGSAGYFVVRMGVPSDTAWAAAQKVDIFPAVLGKRTKQAPEANSVLHVTQRAFVTNTVVEDVAVAA